MEIWISTKSTERTENHFPSCYGYSFGCFVLFWRRYFLLLLFDRKMRISSLGGNIKRTPMRSAIGGWINNNVCVRSYKRHLGGLRLKQTRKFWQTENIYCFALKHTPRWVKHFTTNDWIEIAAHPFSWSRFLLSASPFCSARSTFLFSFSRPSSNDTLSLLQLALYLHFFFHSLLVYSLALRFPHSKFLPWFQSKRMHWMLKSKIFKTVAMCDLAHVVSLRLAWCEPMGMGTVKIRWLRLKIAKQQRYWQMAHSERIPSSVRIGNLWTFGSSHSDRSHFF